MVSRYFVGPHGFFWLITGLGAQKRAAVSLRIAVPGLRERAEPEIPHQCRHGSWGHISVQPAPLFRGIGAFPPCAAVTPPGSWDLASPRFFPQAFPLNRAALISDRAARWAVELGVKVEAV